MAAAAPAAFPLATRQLAACVGGRETQVLLSGFADRVMVVVTQVGTLGTVLHAERESVLGGGATFRVEALLGRRDDPLPELCARQLAERLAAAGCERPLLLCLGLAPGGASLEAVRQIVELVMENPVW